MRTALQILAAVLLTFIVAASVRLSIWRGPWLIYKMRQRSIASECGRIRAGMTLPDVESLIHSIPWPMEESISEHQFSFSRWDTCQVQLDPSTSKVISAHMLATEVH